MSIANNLFQDLKEPNRQMLNQVQHDKRMKEKINPCHPRHPRLKNHAVSVSMTNDIGHGLTRIYFYCHH